MGFFLGIDFGTSGARAIAINVQGQIEAEASISFGDPGPAARAAQWRSALFELVQLVPVAVRGELTAIAINGTSSTVMVCDRTGKPLAPAVMYHETGEPEIVAQLREIAPLGHPVLSASSSLVKLLSLAGQVDLNEAKCLLHQADWLAYQLHGQFGVSDYHNSLKLGYDPAVLAYPQWFQADALQAVVPLLPRVGVPGERVGVVLGAIATQLNLSPTCQIHAGTTDSIAAFLASGASQPGEAVTSLGSTLVLKLLSERRVDESRYGIYSHRLGDQWLVGGASNTGGAVLQDYFTAAELAALSEQIDPRQPSPYRYYPLRQPGERFPVNDPQLQPQLEPRAGSAIAFLHGLLESIARIEALGYARLEEYGATPVQQLYTAGGGAKNLTWTAIRQRLLEVPLRNALHEQAAYGTALLARQSYI